MNINIRTPFGPFQASLDMPAVPSAASGNGNNSGSDNKPTPYIYRIDGLIDQNAAKNLSEFLCNTFKSPLHKLSHELKFVQKETLSGKMFVPEIEEIVVEINSFGGLTSSGFSMYDMLRSIPKEVKLTTLVTSFAASAASVIFCAGDERIAMPGSEILLHQAYFGALFYMKEEDMKAYTASLEKTNQALIDLYSKVTGRSKANIKKDMALTDFILTGTEAVEYGIATTLLKSR